MDEGSPVSVRRIPMAPSKAEPPRITTQPPPPLPSSPPPLVYIVWTSLPLPFEIFFLGVAAVSPLSEGETVGYLRFLEKKLLFTTGGDVFVLEVLVLIWSLLLDTKKNRNKISPN